MKVGGWIALWVCLLAHGAGADDIRCHALTNAEILDTSTFWALPKRAAAVPTELGAMTLEELGLEHAAKAKSSSVGSSSTSTFVAVSKPAPSTVTDPPFRAAGKLYYYDKKREWCTASFTDAPNILLTSAHCVRSQSGPYFTGIFFVRAAVNNSGEVFAIERVATLPEWVTSGTPNRYDYAFLRTTAPVANVTALTFETGSPTKWIAIGYPDAYIESGVPHTPNGATMMHSAGKGTKVSGAGMILMEGIPLKHGMSGGPWVPPPTSPFGSTVVSMASKHVPGEDALVGPIFTERTQKLLEAVKTCN
jgi:hypothetical protein